MALYSNKRSGLDRLMLTKYPVIIEKVSWNKKDQSNIKNAICEKTDTMLHLILQMISVTDRIDLKSARDKFNSLRSAQKIQLPDNLIKEIEKNIKRTGEKIGNYDDIIAYR